MDVNQFEIQKHSSLSHLFIKLGRLLNEKGLNQARKSFKIENLSQTHLDLYPHISFGGSTVNEIAKKKGVSKQAISKIVNEMIEMGLLETKPNPRDARSKIIEFKTKGPYAISKGFKVLEKIDIKLKEGIGESKFLELVDDLNEVLDLVENSKI